MTKKKKRVKTDKKRRRKKKRKRDLKKMQVQMHKRLRVEIKLVRARWKLGSLIIATGLRKEAKLSKSHSNSKNLMFHSENNNWRMIKLRITINLSIRKRLKM
jgi:hypothetical protein